MAQPPAVLLLDDGELEDVQEILERARVPFARVRGGAIVPGSPAPQKLLVATPRRIDMVRADPERESDGEGATRIVVVEGDSTTLRAKLRDVGFDYIVRRPVHPEALRLLLLHCLYSGEERRREPRLAAGFQVSFRTGLLPRRALLVELSSGGCRLHSGYRLEGDKAIRIQIPKAAGVSETLSLEGRVVRAHYDPDLDDGEGLYCAAVVFENAGGEVRRELEWILEERAQGPATLLPHAPEEAEAEAAPSAETADAAASAGRPVGIEVDVDVEEPPEACGAGDGGEAPDGDPEHETGDGEPVGERRERPRAAYPHKVPAFGARSLRVLLGRDLSARGMRVQRCPEARIGDRLHLAIYGDPHEEPFLVWATVSRDDGTGGVALVFDEPHPVVAEQLEKVVAGLPSVESLHDDEAAAMGSVVSRVLDD